jgi:GNAT superfamily N-acetyltransferase
MRRFFARMKQIPPESPLDPFFLEEKFVTGSCERLVARYGRKVVGILSMSYRCSRTKGPAESIDVVFVDPKYRNRGIARMLIERAMDWLLPRTERVQIIAENQAISKIVAQLREEFRDHIELLEPWRERHLTPEERDKDCEARFAKAMKSRLRPHQLTLSGPPICPPGQPTGPWRRVNDVSLPLRPATAP